MLLNKTDLRLLIVLKEGKTMFCLQVLNFEATISSQKARLVQLKMINAMFHSQGYEK